MYENTRAAATEDHSHEFIEAARALPRDILSEIANRLDERPRVKVELTGVVGNRAITITVLGAPFRASRYFRINSPRYTPAEICVHNISRLFSSSHSVNDACGRTSMILSIDRPDLEKKISDFVLTWLDTAVDASATFNV